MMNIIGAHARAPLGHGRLKVQFCFILTLNNYKGFFAMRKGKVTKQVLIYFFFSLNQLNHLPYQQLIL